MPRLERVARNTALQTAGHGVGLAASVVSAALLARYLGVGSFGTYSLLLVGFALLAALGNGSLETVAVRALAGAPASSAGPLLARLVGLRLAVSAVLALAAVGATLVTPASGDLRAAVVLLALASVPAATQATLTTVRQAQLRFALPVLAETVARVTTVAATALVVLGLDPRGRDGTPLLWAAAAPVLAGALLALVVTVLALRRAGVRVRCAYEPDAWRGLALQAAPLAVVTVLGVVNYRIDIVVVGALAGAESAGLYGMAMRFVDAALPVATFFVAAVFPLAAREAGAAGAERRQRALDTLATVAPLGALPLAALAPALVGLVGGDAYEGSVAPLRLLALSLPFSAVAMLLVSFLVAGGRERRLVPIVAASIVVNLALNLALVPAWSATGAAAATLAAEAAGCAVLFALVRRSGLDARRTGAAGGAWLVATVPAVGLEPLPGAAAGTVAYVALAVALRLVDLPRLRVVVVRRLAGRGA